MDALNRVIVLYEIDTNQYFYDRIIDLNKIRNALTHYETSLSRGEIEYIIACILPTVIKLFDNELSQFKNFIHKNDIETKIELLYSKRDAWQLNTILELLDEEVRVENKEYLLNLLNFTPSRYKSVDNFLLYKFEELIFSYQAEEYIEVVGLKKNNTNYKALFEKNTIRVLQQKILFIYSVLINAGPNVLTDKLGDFVNIFNSAWDYMEIYDKLLVLEKIEEMDLITKKYNKFLGESKKITMSKQHYDISETTYEFPDRYQTEKFTISITEVINTTLKALKEIKWYKRGDQEFEDVHNLLSEVELDNLLEKISDDTCFGDVASAIIGKSMMGYYGTVDRIDEVSYLEIKYIIMRDEDDAGNKHFYFIFDGDVGGSSYTSGDFIEGSGSVGITIGAQITIMPNGDEVKVRDIELLEYTDTTFD